MAGRGSAGIRRQGRQARDESQKPKIMARVRLALALLSLRRRAFLAPPRISSSSSPWSELLRLALSSRRRLLDADLAPPRISRPSSCSSSLQAGKPRELSASVPPSPLLSWFAVGAAILLLLTAGAAPSVAGHALSLAG